MKCPECQSALVRRPYEGVEIDQCPSCKGVWLDAGEILRILEVRDVKFTPAEMREAIATAFAGIPVELNHAKFQCPKCSKPLRAVNYNYQSGVLLDRCGTGCGGIWFEHLELEKVQIHAEFWEAEAKKQRAAWVQSLKTAKEDAGKAKEANDARAYAVSGIIARLLKF